MKAKRIDVGPCILGIRHIRDNDDFTGTRSAVRRVASNMSKVKLHTSIRCGFSKNKRRETVCCLKILRVFRCYGSPLLVLMCFHY
jgi:hypothetical protein